MSAEPLDGLGSVRRGGVGSRPTGTTLGRPLQRGRDADRGCGEHQELQKEEQPPDDDPNNPSMDFRGEKLRTETHQSKTDPESRLMHKGKEAKLAFVEHALMENHNGLVLDFMMSEATGTAERETAVAGRCARVGLSSQDVGRRQGLRQQIKAIFGWMKTVGGFRWTWYRGVEGTGLAGYLVAAVCNLVWMAKLMSSRVTRAVQSV